MHGETNKRAEVKGQSGGGKLMTFLNGINLFVTIVIAVLAFFFDQRQKAIESVQNQIKNQLDEQAKQLENRTRQEAITQAYTDKIFAHLADLKLESGDHAGMVIDLFDMITEANINAETFKNIERQQLMPLRMALLTGNDDMLTNIGFVPEKRKLWVDFARQSRNDKVRATALRTLGKIGVYARHESQLGELRLCISGILDISEDFRRAAIYDDAREAIDGLTDVIAKEPILLDDNELAYLFKESTLRLARARSEMLRQPPQPTQPPSEGPKPSRTSYRPESEEAVYLPIVNLESHPAPILLAADARRQLRETDATLEKLGKLNLYAQPVSPAAKPSHEVDATIKDLFEKLYSDKAGDRLKARTALAAQGTVALKPLLNMLQMGNLNLEPRLKVSLCYALYQMPQSVVIVDSGDIKLLLGLLGDEQPEVRHYISEFLMKLSDGNTVRAFYDPLLKIPHDDITKADNAAYNAIVILGTWMRVLPPELDDLKKKIRDDLGRLRQEFSGSGEQSKRTRELLDEMSGLNKARQ